MGQEGKTILRFTADRPGDVAEWPRWDADLRELYFGAEVIKAFIGPAENQEAVFAAFEGANWRRVIDNPLPHEEGVDRRKQLEWTIRRLNGNQHPPRMRFRACEYSRKIAWAPLSDMRPARKRRGGKGKRPKKSDG
jgi:hypothetical protein